MVQGVISGAGWFSLFLVIHILWFHRVHIENCFKLIMKIFSGCLAGHVGTIAVMNWGFLAIDHMVGIFFGLLAMACCFIMYMPFYYTVVTSLSIQTLILLAESPQKKLSLSQLQERFASTRIVEERMKTMVRNGYLKESNGRYCPTFKGHVVARFF